MKTIIRDYLKKSDFFCAPQELFNPKISSQEFQIWSFLASQSDDFHPRIRIIAEKIGKSSRWVIHNLSSLEKKKMVRIEHGHTNKYLVNPPPEWDLSEANLGELYAPKSLSKKNLGELYAPNLVNYTHQVGELYAPCSYIENKKKTKRRTKRMSSRDDTPPLPLEFLNFGKQWLEFAKSKISHGEKSYRWTAEKFAEEAQAVCRICKMKISDLESILAFLREDDFWGPNAVALKGLTKKSKNGLRKIDNIRNAMNQEPALTYQQKEAKRVDNFYSKLIAKEEEKAKNGSTAN